MIGTPFIWFGFSSRDDPVSPFAKNIHNDQHLGLCHSYKDKAIFAIRLAVIDKLDRQRVAEDVARLFKRDAMLAQIRSRLVVIPFKLFIQNCIRYARSFS
jgi:hypothetical protein